MRIFDRCISPINHQTVIIFGYWLVNTKYLNRLLFCPRVLVVPEALWNIHVKCLVPMRGNSCRCFMTKYFSMNPSNVLILEVLSICMISTQAFKFIKAVETRTDISNSNYDNTSGNDISLVPQRPLFPVNRNKQLSFNPSNYKCNQKHSSVCQNKTIMYREKVLSEFKTSMLTEKDKSNFYNVEYEHIEGVIKYNPSCMILDAKVRYLTNSDTPFDTSEIGCLFPKRELFGKKFLSTSKSCVIVSSAGSLHNSGLGKFIGTYRNLHSV